MACCGDVPTLETLAAVDILRRELPDAEGARRQRRRPDAAPARQRASARPLRPRLRHAVHRDRPVIFAYHGYPWLIHRLTYRRTNHDNLHVRGYKEEGTTTTPFDMVMLNDLDRFHLVIDVIDRVPGLGSHAAELRQRMVDERLRCRAYTRDRGRRSRPRSATGRGPTCGRAECASSSSTPARAASSSPCSTSDDDAAACRPAFRSPRGPGRRGGAARGARAGRPDRCRRPPDRARRQRARRAGAGRRARASGACEALVDLAPLHQPKSLRALDLVSRLLPGVPAVACFDTAFHARIPPAAATYALPR